VLARAMLEKRSHGLLFDMSDCSKKQGVGQTGAGET
jgi:hypothetical protein